MFSWPIALHFTIWAVILLVTHALLYSLEVELFSTISAQLWTVKLALASIAVLGQRAFYSEGYRLLEHEVLGTDKWRRVLGHYRRLLSPLAVAVFSLVGSLLADLMNWLPPVPHWGEGWPPVLYASRVSASFLLIGLAAVCWVLFLFTLRSIRELTYLEAAGASETNQMTALEVQKETDGRLLISAFAYFAVGAVVVSALIARMLGLRRRH